MNSSARWRLGDCVSLPLVVGMQSCAAALKNGWAVFSKRNINVPYDPEIPSQDIYPWEITTYTHIKIYVNVDSNFIYNYKTGHNPDVLAWWVDEEMVVRPYGEIRRALLVGLYLS